MAIDSRSPAPGTPSVDPAIGGEPWAEWCAPRSVRLLLCGHARELDAVVRALNARGAAVSRVGPDASALAEVAVQAFDAVVIDRDLRDEGGRVLFAGVRGRWPDAPVIMLVGQEDDAAAVDAMEAGVDQCVIRTSAFHRRLPYAVRALLRRAEQQRRLLSTVEELERVLSLAPVGIVVSRTQDCAVVTSNDHARRMFDAAPGTNLSASAPRDERFRYVIRRDGRDVPADEMPLQYAARTGRPVQNELLQFVGENGKVTEFVMGAVPLRDAAGRPRGAVGALQDVTALRALQARLQDSEERLRLAVDHAGIATWDMHLRTQRSVWSRTHFEMLGYPPRPGGEADLAMWLSRVHPDDAERVAAAWDAAVRSGTAEYRAEYRIVRADDGGVRWLSSVGRFVAGDDGAPARAVGVSVDVTEHRLEEMRRQYHYELAEALHSAATPQAAMEAAARLLARHLRVPNAGYASVGADGTVHVEAEAVEPPRRHGLAGRAIRFDGFASLFREMTAGRVVAIGDVRADPRTAAAAHRLEALEVGAFATASLRRGGRLVAYLYVTDVASRAWRDDELALMRETADRTWSAVERAQAEIALREREAQFRAILDNSGASLYAIDRGGRLLFVNRSFEAVMGKPASELVGRRLDEVFEPATAAGFLAHNEAVMRDGPQEYDEVAHYGDVVRWYRSVKNPLRDASGAVVGIVGLSSDVTERRLATEQIERHRQELQTMFEVLPVGVAIAHDANAERVTGSPGLAQLLGGEYPDLSPRSIVPFGFWQDGRRLAFAELPLQRATRAGVPVRDFHAEIRFDDGRTLHVMINAAPLYGSDGAVRGGIAAVVDVTALKLVQQELQEADRQKDEFLATLAHELRNPMAPIRYAAAMLRADASPEVLEQARATIARQSAQMARLLDDLLDMSRITRNVIRLERGTLDLRTLVADAIDAVRPAAQQQAQTVACVAPDEPVWVDGDPLRLVQVLGNLLNNACKYTPAGGRIDVAVELDGEHALVRVRDTGVGLTAEMLPKVFELFSQVHKGLTASKGGLGIGLAVAKRLTELHGGTLAVRSEGLDRGAEFTLRLPRVAAVRGSPDPLPAVAPGPCGTLRVLVVDDNEDGAASLALLLRAQGLSADVAHTGAQALRLADELRPDVILLDVGLPDVSGLDVARRLRSTAWGARIRIVAVTGWGQELDRLRSRDAGVDEHVVKPVDPAELFALLREPEAAPVHRATA